MAENIGKVVQVIGPTVDCEFDSDNLPEILNAIKIDLLDQAGEEAGKGARQRGHRDGPSGFSDGRGR